MIVSISDIHGYLDDGTRALLALGDTEVFDPIVTRNAGGQLEWDGNDYVLGINGDLIDRGPENGNALRTVEKLTEEAPLGRCSVQERARDPFRTTESLGVLYELPDESEPIGPNAGRYERRWPMDGDPAPFWDVLRR